MSGLQLRHRVGYEGYALSPICRCSTVRTLFLPLLCIRSWAYGRCIWGKKWSTFKLRSLGSGRRSAPHQGTYSVHIDGTHGRRDLSRSASIHRNGDNSGFWAITRHCSVLPDRVTGLTYSGPSKSRFRTFDGEKINA